MNFCNFLLPSMYLNKSNSRPSSKLDPLPPSSFANLHFQEGATSLSVLRSVWKTYWMYKNQDKQNDTFDQLKESLNELDDRFEKLLQQLRDVRWDIDHINLKVFNDVSIEEIQAD